MNYFWFILLFSPLLSAHYILPLLQWTRLSEDIQSEAEKDQPKETWNPYPNQTSPLFSMPMNSKPSPKKIPSILLSFPSELTCSIPSPFLQISTRHPTNQTTNKQTERTDKYRNTPSFILQKPADQPPENVDGSCGADGNGRQKPETVEPPIISPVGPSCGGGGNGRKLPKRCKALFGMWKKGGVLMSVLKGADIFADDTWAGVGESCSWKRRR